MPWKKCLNTAVILHGICCLHLSNAFAPTKTMTHVVGVLLKPTGSSTCSSSTSNTLLHQNKEDPRSYGGNVPKSNTTNQRGNNGTNQSRNSNQNKNGKNTSRNQNPTEKRLETSLGNLFDISQGSSTSTSTSKYYPTQDGDIDIYESMSSSTRTPRTGTSMEPQDDAPLLDESMYLNSEQYMDEDGSFVGQKNSQLDNDMQKLLVTLMNDHPGIPQDDEFTQEYGFNTDTDTNNGRASASASASMPEGNTVDDQALLESIISQNNAKANTSIDGEELHKRVFANEKGFLQQSELFRESLVPDPDQEKKHEAAVLRRGTEYRKQQEETLKHMFEEMDEFERSILSREDAKKLAAERTTNVANGRMDDDGTIDVGGESELDLDPTTILCSKCSCLLSAEEVIFERKKGRPNPSEMICRLCQVDSMQMKKGSPYLMGRLGRNGKFPPRMGIPSPPQNRIVRRKIEQIRKIGPRNDDGNEDVHSSSNSNSDDAVPKENGKRTRTEAQSNAWREQYTNAMSQQRGVLMRGAPTSTSASPSASTSTSTSSMTNGTNTLSNGNDRGNTGSTINDNQIHRYSNRPQELKMKKDTYADESVWNAHFKAATHRRQGIEHTGVAYKSKSTSIGNTSTSMNTSTRTNTNANTNNATTNSQNNQGKDAEAKANTKAEAEIKNLRGQINNLLETIEDYKGQQEKSSKQIIALQSVMEGMKKTINRPVKRKPTPWNTRTGTGTVAASDTSAVASTGADEEGNDARSKVVKEVGEGIVRGIGQRHRQSQPMPRRPVERLRQDVDHDEIYLDDP